VITIEHSKVTKLGPRAVVCFVYMLSNISSSTRSKWLTELKGSAAKNILSCQQVALTWLRAVITGLGYCEYHTVNTKSWRTMLGSHQAEKDLSLKGIAEIKSKSMEDRELGDHN